MRNQCLNKSLGKLFYVFAPRGEHAARAFLRRRLPQEFFHVFAWCWPKKCTTSLKATPLRIPLPSFPSIPHFCTKYESIFVEDLQRLLAPEEGPGARSPELLEPNPFSPEDGPSSCEICGIYSGRKGRAYNAQRPSWGLLEPNPPFVLCMEGQPKTGHLSREVQCDVNMALGCLTFNPLELGKATQPVKLF